MKNGLWGSVIFLLVFGQALYASPLEKIPTDSWVYPVIDRLYTAGLFPKLHRSLKPYTRGQIAGYLRDIRQDQSSGRLVFKEWQQWLIQKLEDEFRYELRGLNQSKGFRNLTRISCQGVASLKSIEDQPSLGRGELFLSGSWEWDNKFIFQIRGVLDNRGEEDPNFFAQNWKKGLTGMFDRGYWGVQLSPFYLTLGRDYFRWGPADQGLLWSGQTPALDFINFELGRGRLKFNYFTSQLDTLMTADSLGNPQSAKRYISGHRLNYRHPSGWEIGLSEIILYGGVDRGVELFYLNPVLPYYVEQYNQYVDDNSLWNLEFALTFWKNKEFYGELLIDDFQYDFVSEPHQMGLTLGTKLADFLGWQGSYWNLQYTRIGTFVYGQQKPWNRYTYQDVVLGHVLGSDFDQWQASFEYLPHPDFALGLKGEYRRQGEMTADSLYPNPIPKNIPFPSGVVEKSWIGSVVLRYQPNAHLIGNLNFSYQDFKNFLHLSGQKKSEWTLRVRLDYNFWKEFWF